MTIIATLLASKLARRIIAGIVILLTIAGLVFAAHHEHQRALSAESKISAAQAETAAIRAQAAASITALESVSARTSARNAITGHIRDEIHAAPPSSSCADSPAVRALLAGLRERSAGAH
ncbi:hypothetical protein FHR90_003308 [Endobacter medicaginis]|uniref:Uncharacterized protein n=1 Tax=Endobacter medicaginis TaxID=1181271 RepID=A0A839V7C7_9PROT|nr:hypothetical protein [Endobacter medicaginis]MBB3175452.1 hypothetical protein [Endobacter medicaginis]MCX5477113.1 hypothetical protein [Endobacter medicaginis]NVN29830.1 hypothetical protein [Endobacter medicaginis]